MAEEEVQDPAQACLHLFWPAADLGPRPRPKLEPATTVAVLALLLVRLSPGDLAQRQQSSPTPPRRRLSFASAFS